MRPNESFVGQPIRSLQTMLRVLGEYDTTHPTVTPDGIYGPQTVHAVSHFQRRHGLPVTGVTDHDTWEAIVAAYEPALVHQDVAQTLDILMDPGQSIRQGEQHLHLHLVQGMLAALSQVHKSVSMPSRSGLLDAPTADSLASFQELSALPMTGVLDKHTWKHLALHYPLAASLDTRRG